LGAIGVLGESNQLVRLKTEAIDEG
jgi:hypothetical protein